MRTYRNLNDSVKCKYMKIQTFYINRESKSLFMVTDQCFPFLKLATLILPYRQFPKFRGLERQQEEVNIMQSPCLSNCRYSYNK